MAFLSGSGKGDAGAACATTASPAHPTDLRSDLVNGLPRRRRRPDCENADTHVVTPREHAVSPEDLRRRACDLADTARYNHWEEIGAALEADGVNLAGEKLGADAVLRRMLNARCAISRSRKE